MSNNYTNISIRIVDNKDNGRSNLPVYLYNLNTTNIASSGTTDGGGFCLLTGISAGTYDITAQYNSKNYSSKNYIVKNEYINNPDSVFENRNYIRSNEQVSFAGNIKQNKIIKVGTTTGIHAIPSAWVGESGNSSQYYQNEARYQNPFTLDTIQSSGNNAGKIFNDSYYSSNASTQFTQKITIKAV